eukprot:4284644-Alexandrium_andersonii.AAC.1
MRPGLRLLKRAISAGTVPVSSLRLRPSPCISSGCMGGDRSLLCMWLGPPVPIVAGSSIAGSVHANTLIRGR